MGREPLPQRVLDDQEAGLFGDRTVTAQGEFRAVELLEGGQPLLLQRERRRGYERTHRTGQRASAPEPQRRAQKTNRLVQPANRTRGVRLGYAGSERGEIEVRGIDGQPVPAGPASQRVFQVGRPHDLPQARNASVDLGPRAGRGFVGPQGLHELVDGDRLPVVQQQIGQEGALLRPQRRIRCARARHLDGAEYAPPHPAAPSFALNIDSGQSLGAEHGRFSPVHDRLPAMPTRDERHRTPTNRQVRQAYTDAAVRTEGDTVLAPSANRRYEREAPTAEWSGHETAGRRTTDGPCDDSSPCATVCGPRRPGPELPTSSMSRSA
jgi:hypothetical protein